MMYSPPSITSVGTVQGLTLGYPQNCKYGHGADNTLPNQLPGLADGSGDWKPGCGPGDPLS
ncbi:hypothetical protein [Cellulosimicrobium arenosum]|uniref:Uncharacterized protein n=1 Tax=Cellulosimicrobium arenosum TaxID=2708133 RepID=A0A927G9A3_9MICO|nr:hypothetical protein [Cellulosimicrobium arenosum]MBD8078934.1 hypothetical protein [Cellulosimicrobium arenosum]